MALLPIAPVLLLSIRFGSTPIIPQRSSPLSSFIPRKLASLTSVANGVIVTFTGSCPEDVGKLITIAP